MANDNKTNGKKTHSRIDHCGCEGVQIFLSALCRLGLTVYIGGLLAMKVRGGHKHRVAWS